MKGKEDKPRSVPLMVRLPAPLHHTIHTLADQGYRSLNSQIIMLIEQALALHEAPPAVHRRPS